MVESFSLQFLNDLLTQTCELRRDPQEREEEIQREEAKRWLEENRGATLVFENAEGDVEEINVSDFDWVD